MILFKIQYVLRPRSPEIVFQFSTLRYKTRKQWYAHVSTLKHHIKHIVRNKLSFHRGTRIYEWDPSRYYCGTCYMIYPRGRRILIFRFRAKWRTHCFYNDVLQFSSFCPWILFRVERVLGRTIYNLLLYSTRFPIFSIMVQVGLFKRYAKFTEHFQKIAKNR